MLKNLAIVALLAANGGLIAYMLQQPVEVVTETVRPQATVVAAAQLPATVALPEPIAADASDGDLIEALDDAGLAEALVRQLIYAKALLDNAPEKTGDDVFWQRNPRRGATTLARLERRASVRDQLVDAFGEAIKDDPQFVDLFKPLNDSLSFLSSDKQVAIFDIRMRQQADRSIRFAGGMLRENRQQARDSQAMMDEEIQSLLSAAEYEEYELRESPLSHRMRRSADLFDYTEEEFREIFRILDESRSAAGGPRWRRNEESDARIAAYLGNDRFDEYTRSQDPAYRSIRLIGDQGGHTDAEVAEVYEIQKSAIEEMRSVSQDRSLERQVRQERIIEIRSSAELGIANVMGEDSADSVMQNTLGRRPVRR